MMILNFVVAGNEVVVHAHPDDHVRDVVDIALKCARYTRNANDSTPFNWEVRNDLGELLNEDDRVGDVTHINQQIFVTLPAGTGA